MGNMPVPVPDRDRDRDRDRYREPRRKAAKFKGAEVSAAMQHQRVLTFDFSIIQGPFWTGGLVRATAVRDMRMCGSKGVGSRGI